MAANRRFTPLAGVQYSKQRALTLGIFEGLLAYVHIDSVGIPTFGSGFALFKYSERNGKRYHEVIKPNEINSAIRSIIPGFDVLAPAQLDDAQGVSQRSNKRDIE